MQEFGLVIDQSVLKVLLLDRTTRKNIVWGTTDFSHMGADFAPDKPVLVKHVVDFYVNIMHRRARSSLALKQQRKRNNGEVFTPAWICNAQNNLIDERWFGRDGVFNSQQGKQWVTTQEPVRFPAQKSKSWQKYVDLRRMEITCGEAPYLVSRYDLATGEAIPIEERIGIVDRKLRIVRENSTTDAEWQKWTLRAFESVYGYELFGSSLLMARLNLMNTFVEHYRLRFSADPDKKNQKAVALRISWNLWQMDGYSYTVPSAVKRKQDEGQRSLFDLETFGEEEREQWREERRKSTQGRKYCRVKDWRANKSHEYRELVKEDERDG